MTDEEIKTFIEQLFHLLNGQDRFLTEQLGVALKHEHPTLQQNFWRMVAEVAEVFNRSGYTDERNADSKKLVHAIVRARQQEKIQLPLI